MSKYETKPVSFKPTPEEIALHQFTKTIPFSHVVKIFLFAYQKNPNILQQITNPNNVIVPVDLYKFEQIKEQTPVVNTVTDYQSTSENDVVCDVNQFL